MMMFASREDAGQRLGDYLKEQNVTADLVLGLPRGGVVVAAEVARALAESPFQNSDKLAGTPEQSAAKIQAFADLGVETFILRFPDLLRRVTLHRRSPPGAVPPPGR